ncbi:lipopolysaccharide-induced tumor necrosis factor-alpha factor homolog isoform X2 [Ambystoma mexicanum]|uniref:lipopolysaccharide-induced tumor necrosis factor-alpha factor homolog isoform X2 n=1 Tax=Ambystoma mexicanum TaxID=8296 RepID=UPI0037E990A0
MYGQPQNPAYQPNYQGPYQQPGYAPQPQPPPFHAPQQPAGQTSQQAGGTGGMQNQIVINVPPTAQNSGQASPPQRGYQNPGGPAVMIGNMSRETPMRTTCPACQQPIVTSISYTSGAMAWLLCILLALLGCILGCCLIPFFVDSCKDVNHYCPSCNHLVAKHKRL